jgi:hypothetical protein
MNPLELAQKLSERPVLTDANPVNKDVLVERILQWVMKFNV